MPTVHLTDADHEAIAAELDALRQRVTAELGARDAAYIHRVIAWQRGLEAGGRAVLQIAALLPRDRRTALRRSVWAAGTATLSLAKILENMEIGHNVMHGQWDWMRDPKIHSTTWEWDAVAPADLWKHLHNVVHHTNTNVLGVDDDLGFGLLRITPEQPWNPACVAQPLYALLLMAFFEYGVAVADLEIDKILAGEDDREVTQAKLRTIRRKIARQWSKDYVAFPLLSGRRFGSTLLANFVANTVRNLWATTVIYCGHFPGDVEVFPPERLDGETHGQWYVRQLTGSANIAGGRVLDLLSGNLSHQIEHHLFPDMPSHRLAKIAPQVRALCDKYDLPYNSASLARQVGSTWKKIFRLSLP
ncbi:fatty acid desaturase family protein [Actinomadura rayongensis]|uniref:Acyl-CoA desaturase n=1 Tax=Actinomadura rayongensis TaxID=1429076 RepID=A0A6I4WFK5_9ACTN|nr:acyl-CoA desaturase [Actinomadura rayongensis]MXQ65744.1 acyl-CoA desaturase [Actinomadura rayongensis]